MFMNRGNEEPHILLSWFGVLDWFWNPVGPVLRLLAGFVAPLWPNSQTALLLDMTLHFHHPVHENVLQGSSFSCEVNRIMEAGSLGNETRLHTVRHYIVHYFKRGFFMIPHNALQSV